ncbi:hypothetical protein NPIL_426501 [Nephila pilipes]|uniref:Uncharacterized protein n=1 Tax=Nephila pilipes TaxID=299642 RepID=A0A8X6U924_NEPPI|nr:hypothetical protein NPIL_426501 [Nephila pilipes]
MAANMKDFLAKKRAQKAMITKLKQKLSEPNLSLSALELLRTKFKSLQDEFNSIFDPIINLSDEVNVEKDMDEQNEINAIIIHLEFDVNIKSSKFNQNKVESSIISISKNSVREKPSFLQNENNYENTSPTGLIVDSNVRRNSQELDMNATPFVTEN